MAGQPRSRGASTRTLRQGRPKRRNAQLRAEIRVAPTAADRFYAVADSIRGVFKRRTPNRDAYERELDDITRLAMDLHSRILKDQAREPRKAKAA